MLDLQLLNAPHHERTHPASSFTVPACQSGELRKFPSCAVTFARPVALMWVFTPANLNEGYP